MKFTQIPVFAIALLVPAIAALPSTESAEQSANSVFGQIEARACKAAGSCKGIGGGDLCNDRVRNSHSTGLEKRAR